MSFAEFRAAYPKRRGSQPWHPAEKKYLTAIKNGADESHIISSARRYAEELQAQGKIDTEFVCMAVTWLNQKRWIDYAPSVDEEKKFAETQAKLLTLGWKWTGEKWEKLNGAATHTD